MRASPSMCVLVTLLGACPEPGPRPHQVCEPGRVEICPCDGGGQGSQTCNSDGTAWSDCRCSAQGDGGAPDTAGQDLAGSDRQSSNDAGLPEGGGDDAPGDDIPRQDECSVPRDCGAGYDCVLDDDGYRVCVKLFCTEDVDCDLGAGEHCDLRRGMCLVDTCRPGLEGACPPGQVCLAGACADPPPPADSCEITPATAVVRAGATTALGVSGYMSSGALAPFSSFTWSSSDDACAEVDGSGVVTGAASASSACTATITATPVGGGTPCTAAVTTLPAVSPPALRALVVEDLSGEPVSGAQVLVRTDDGAGGAVTELSPVTTDASGQATIADVGAADVGRILDVSVFHQGYTYVTVVRPRANDLLFQLHEVADDTVMAGIKSVEPSGMDFSQVHTQGDIKVGFAGLSLPGLVADVPPLHQLGLPLQRDIHLEGIGDFDDETVLSSMYHEIGAARVKADFQVFGTPGQRCLWGIGGKLKLAELGPNIAQLLATEESTYFTALFLAALPRLSTLDHSLVTGIELVEVARPQDGSEPSTWDFGTDPQQLVLATLLSQTITAQLPTMPQLPGPSGAYPVGVLVSVATLLPGQGAVTLGLGVGADAPEDGDPIDGVVDPTPCPPEDPGCIQPARGEVFVDFAPPHGGLEGAPYMVVATTRDLRRMFEPSSTFSLLTSVVEGVEDSHSFAAGAFLAFPTAATYVVGASYQQAAPVADAGFYRLDLDSGGRGWQVYFDDAVTGVALPTPPDGLEERVENARIQALATSGGAFGVRELFEHNGTNVADLVWLTEAFVSLECRRLEQPQQGGCDADLGYVQDSATGLCVGGPDDITAFAAGTAGPCSGMSGYEPVYTGGAGSAGICARTPGCRVE